MANTSLFDSTAVQRHVAELVARNKWSRCQLLDLRERRLNTLLRHAVTASPFYHETIGNAVAAGASLQDLPALSKRSLMDQWDRIVTDPRLRLRDVEAHLAGERPGELLLGKYRTFATGGATGERAVVVYDGAAWLWTVANMLRWVQTLGARPDTRVVGIGAPSPLHITNRAFAELQGGRDDAPRLSVLTPLQELVDRLNSYQPEMIFTYPSFVRRLVEEQEAGRLQIHPSRIASTAEVLAPDVRGLIWKTWNARVLDSYGTTEAGLLGIECDAAMGIHVAEDMVVYEVVDQAGRPVADGTPGNKVLVTNLFNRTLPLIRYEISDITTLDSGLCVCGRPYARVTAIDGRREDYLTLQALGGGTIHIHAARLCAPLAGVPGLRQFQVVPGAGHLKVRVSIRSPADAQSARASTTEIVRRALHEMGADVLVTTEVVEVIQGAGTAAKERLVMMR